MNALADIGPPADAPLPSILMPYQIEAVRLSRNHQLTVVEKSRRTGLTYGFAADAVLTAAPADGAQDVFYIAYNLDMTREFVGYCGDFARAFDAAPGAAQEFLFDDGSDDGIKAFRIDFPSGKSIVALSSKPRSLRGKQGVVIIDEAAFHEQLDELLKAAIALLMWGGRVIVISTHDGVDNPFNLLVERIRAGKQAGAVMRIDIEEALAQGLYKRICLVSGMEWSPAAEADWLRRLKDTYGEAAEEELYVIPARGSGTYLGRRAIRAAMSPDHAVVRLRLHDDFIHWPEGRAADHMEDWFDRELRPRLAALDPSRRSYFGQDFARSSDLSAVAVGQEDRLLNLQVPFILEMRNVPFREQEWILKRIVERLPMFSGGKMDARGNGQQLAEEMQRTYGAALVEGIMASQSTYLDGYPRLKARIEDRSIVIPQDEDVLDDLRMVKLVRGVPMIPDRRESKADGAKAQRHGDNAIALMFLALAADMDVAPIDIHRLPESRESAERFTTTRTGFGTVRRAAGPHLGV